MIFWCTSSYITCPCPQWPCPSTLLLYHCPSLWSRCYRLDIIFLLLYLILSSSYQRVMRLHLSVSVCFGGFVACSTALSSSAYKTSGSTIPSRVAGESTKIATASASIPSVTSHEPCLLASKAIASFTSFNSSGTRPKASCG